MKPLSELMEIALTASETGHLVFCTLHTINAGQSINRILGLFERSDAARRTANDLARPGWLSLHTRTLNRREYGRRVAAGL